MMKRKIVSVLLVLVVVLGLAACKEKKTVIPRDPVASGDLTGIYWLHTMRDGGEEMDREMLEMFGFDDSYLQLNADGTAVLSFTGEDRVELEYDEDEGVLYNETGDTMSFTVDGDEITLLHDGSEMVFKRDSGSQAATTAPSTAPTTAPAVQESMAPDQTEPEDPTEPDAPSDPVQPSQDDPTEAPVTTTGAQPTGATEQQPGYDEPSEPVATQPEETGVAGMYWLYEISSEGDVMGYDILKLAGIDDSYLRLDADGTGELYLTDEDIVTLVYDDVTLSSGSGEPMLYTLEGDKLTMWTDGSTEILVFVREGSPLL